MPGRLAEHLGDILLEETRQFRRLLTLLADEQSALRVADGAAVMSALREQEVALARIRALQGQRQGVLATLAEALGLDPAPLTLSRLLQALPEAAGALVGVREELRTLLAEVRRVNERNVVLVSRGLGYLDRLIAHLTAAVTVERLPAYSARGRTAAAVSSLGLVDRRA